MKALCEKNYNQDIYLETLFSIRGVIQEEPILSQNDRRRVEVHWKYSCRKSMRIAY